jgi:hypothetical protein
MHKIVDSTEINDKYFQCAFWRALSTEQYQSDLIIRLLCWPLIRMPCLSELYYSAEILFRNWLCLTEFDWYGSLVVSIGIRKPTHLQERDQVLLLWGRSLVLRWHFRVSWSLETACRQSKMWLKKPNLGLTRHCPLNKHLHKMGLIDEPICITCGMADESAFHLLWNCPSLISLRVRTFSNPILSVEKNQGASASALLRFALASGRSFYFSSEWCTLGPICCPRAEIFISPTFNTSIHPTLIGS